MQLKKKNLKLLSCVDSESFWREGRGFWRNICVCQRVRGIFSVILLCRYSTLIGPSPNTPPTPSSKSAHGFENVISCICIHIDIYLKNFTSFNKYMIHSYIISNCHKVIFNTLFKLCKILKNYEKVFLSTFFKLSIILMNINEYIQLLFNTQFVISFEKYCALIQYLRHLIALIWQFLSHKKKYSEIVHVFYVTILLTKRWKGFKKIDLKTTDTL